MQGEPKTVKWRSIYKKQISLISSSSKQMGYYDRVAALEAASVLLNKETFIYKSETERCTGCKTLLQWYDNDLSLL